MSASLGLVFYILFHALIYVDFVRKMQFLSKLIEDHIYI